MASAFDNQSYVTPLYGVFMPYVVLAVNVPHPAAGKKKDIATIRDIVLRNFIAARTIQKAFPRSIRKMTGMRCAAPEMRCTVRMRCKVQLAR